MAYLKKTEILEKMRNLGIYKEEYESSGRPELLQILHAELQKPVTVSDSPTNNETPTGNAQSEAVADAIPKMYSPEWTNYVRSKFQKNELISDAPTCDGLRRVFEEVLGTIVSVKSDVVLAPRVDNHSRAAVVVTLRYRKHNDDFREIFEISDGADVCAFNTAAPYCNYPVATAITTAEGRCLKKALRLVKVLTAEEKQSGGADAEAMNEATNNSLEAIPMQKGVIRQLAEKNKIDIGKLIISMAEDISSKTIESLTYPDAQKMITRLGLYNKGPDDGGLVIPESIVSN